MNSSNQAHSSAHTGAHRAHGRMPHEAEQPPPFRHEPYLDGLFTYCLSVLCDHDTATDVLGDVLAVAERHPGRCPDEGDRRAWLYALARWGCLHRLAEHRRARQGAHSARRAPEHTGRDRAPGDDTQSDRGQDTHRPLDVSAYRRTELARLAWPEAAGTTPEQREALELAVRHRLGVPELAAVLGTPAAAARELLSGAACEVERTRAALAVVETGNCPSVSRLTGEDGDGNVLLSSTLRAELVRHVDDCPRCRRVAERVGAAGPWPGSGGLNTAALPLVPAPRTAVHAAMLRSGRGRGRGPAPRFDRTGFPMDPKDRAARRDRLRARVVTTTVVATVVAAPVLALWAAYRGGPGTGEPAGGDAPRISASESELPVARTDGRPLTAYENTGNAATTTSGPGFAQSDPASDVSVEIISTGPPATPDHPGSAGRLTVAASAQGAVTLLTLTASGGAPVDWRLWSDAPWLRASRTAGTLAPGESVTLRIAVDPEGQPVGAWTARVGVDPSGAVVSIQGRGRPAATPAPTPDPTRPATPAPSPDPTQPSTPPPSPTEPTIPPPSPTPEPTPADGSGGTVSPAPDPAPSASPGA
ncbi:BACON domain-containing protein [Streptomyces kutzneri]|uniref:BACON domain-containing protein n=1 Tax=Streptomyces kutzneri TaxID=3051179 RepID=UPI003F9B1790